MSPERSQGSDISQELVIRTAEARAQPLLEEADRHRRALEQENDRHQNELERIDANCHLFELRALRGLFKENAIFFPVTVMMGRKLVRALSLGENWFLWGQSFGQTTGEEFNSGPLSVPMFKDVEDKVIERDIIATLLVQGVRKGERYPRAVPEGHYYFNFFFFDQNKRVESRSQIVQAKGLDKALKKLCKGLVEEGVHEAADLGAIYEEKDQLLYPYSLKERSLPWWDIFDPREVVEDLVGFR
ncbi:MAG: hypothetical protein M1514_00185 [Patescibacteria group bacterium]|nr:hypothetical protein [Patescibacteria group bacterium]